MKNSLQQINDVSNVSSFENEEFLDGPQFLDGIFRWTAKRPFREKQ